MANDFRGYLSSQAGAGDANAKTALNWVGNDGNLNPDVAQGVGPGNAMYLAQYVKGAYDTYNKARTTPQAAPRTLGASTTAGFTPNDAAAYDQAIGNTQSALNRSGAQLNSGYSTIDASYKNALNQLLLGKNQANEAYTGQKKTAATDYVGAKNTIGANAGNTLSGLLRLLGSKGAGGSSTYNISAPGAVARGATLQRTDAANQFGANNQALDTNWNNYLTGYNNEVSSAGNQRDQQRQGLEQSINQNKASLLQTLAQLSAQKATASGGNSVGAAQPFLNQANSILDHLSNYTTKPIDFKTQAYQAPSLASYSTNPQAAPTYQGQGPANDYFSPYLQALLNKKQPGLA